MKTSRILLVLIVLSAAAIPIAFMLLPRDQGSCHTLDSDSVDAKNADGSFKYTNRLIHEQSPYLLQHAHNPVEWYPWGEEAFDKARKEDKPIFLSVGYSTCHWCHVMERESFSQPDVAKILNERFVVIKVDREERPDIDDVYMTAVQLITNSGGWPETTVLLPDGRPFFGGTYFPKATLMDLLMQLADAYKNKRSQVEQVAARVTEAMKQVTAERAKGSGPLTPAVAQAAFAEAVATLRDRYDSVQGGFGGAPKFPPHTSFPLLFMEYERSKDKQTLAMATNTLDAMALGGIHDHLGGGFHRYSTDEKWKLPHFEKMLYDNAQLGRDYTEAYRITGNAVYKEVADSIYGWVLREMVDPGGGFYTALDADSEGVEGKYYVWTKKEILAVLGPVDGALFARVYNVEDGGNYEEQAGGKKNGTSVLYLKKPLDQIAKDEGQEAAAFAAKMAALRSKLLAARDKRIRPNRDDKVLAGWNGLMIGSLARAGVVLKEPAYTNAATRAAEFVEKSIMRSDGLLLRRWRAEKAGVTALLEDYAYLADGLLDLYDATGEKKWLTIARSLADTMLAKFWDKDGGNGGFFETDEQTELLIRIKNPYDNAIPSGNAVAARVLARLAKATGEPQYATTARATFTAFQGTMQGSPTAMQTMVTAAASFLQSGAAATDTNGALPLQADAPTNGPIQISASANPEQVAPGERVQVRLALTIESGWHINSHTPLTGDLIPTRVNLGNGSLLVSPRGEISYPEGQRVTLGFSKEPLSVYQGKVVLAIPLVVAKDAKPGLGRIVLRVQYQPCNDSFCLAPETREIKVPIVIR